MGIVTDTQDDLLTEVESLLKQRYEEKDNKRSRLPSSAAAATPSERMDQLVLPLEKRPKMPYTKDKYLVRENPQLVAWERETRKFLRNLSPVHGHRVAATMVYEWVTGISVKEMIEQGGTPSPDLRKINQVLRYYFGKSYSTYIMNRKVPNCYRVPPGWLVKRHRPMTMELYAEYAEGTLNP